MKHNYILGLDEADMKKIRGFRLRLVNLFFPSLIEVLKETASDKATYQERVIKKLDYIGDLKDYINKLTKELNELKVARDERLRKAKTNHSMVINDYQVALQSEQEKNERLKKEIKALNKTISKLKEQSKKDNELERSIKAESEE